MIDIRCKRTVIRFITAVLVVGAAAIVPVSAQDQPAPAQPAMEGFVPMSEVTNREVLPAAPLVFYAYAVVWVTLLGYLWAIWRRVGRVEQDLDAVRRRMGDGRGGQ
jgi:CcmD family protein